MAVLCSCAKPKGYKTKKNTYKNIYKKNTYKYKKPKDVEGMFGFHNISLKCGNPTDPLKVSFSTILRQKM